MSEPLWKRCEATGKRGYLSRKAARYGTRHAGLRLRVYLCRRCGHYHVTKNVFRSW